MYEYHGWITLRMTPGEIDNEEALLWEAHQKIKNVLSSFNHRNRISDLKIMNGQYFLWIAGSANHASTEAKDLFELLELISSKTLGSYGLVYIHDDEAPEGLSNKFQVVRVARGQVEKFQDNLLSPCIPVIEDP
jgi:hypothetical protein